MSDLKCTAKEGKILLEKTKHDGKVAPAACGCSCSGESAEKEVDANAEATHNTENPPTPPTNK